MKTSIRAELLKLRTTRVFWGYVAAALAFVPVSVALSMTTGPDDAAPLDSSAGVRGVMSAASSGGLLAPARRHLDDGRRVPPQHGDHDVPDQPGPAGAWSRRSSPRASIVGIGVAARSPRCSPSPSPSRGCGARTSRSACSAATSPSPCSARSSPPPLAAVVGIGLGALLRNQALAITVVVVWTATVEPLLVGFVPEIGRWFPGGAVSALAGTVTAEGGLLPVWGAALLLAGYGLAFAAAGTRFVLRRDVV